MEIKKENFSLAKFVSTAFKVPAASGAAGNETESGVDLQKRKENELARAMAIVSPKNLFSWLCLHFLGYANNPSKDEESLEVFFARLDKVIVNQRTKFIYDRFVKSHNFTRAKSEGFSPNFVTETGRLLDEFEPIRRPLVQSVVLGERGIVLTDVAYYRRKHVRRYVNLCIYMRICCESMFETGFAYCCVGMARSLGKCCLILKCFNCTQQFRLWNLIWNQLAKMNGACSYPSWE